MTSSWQLISLFSDLTLTAQWGKDCLIFPKHFEALYLATDLFFDLTLSSMAYLYYSHTFKSEAKP